MASLSDHTAAEFLSYALATPAQRLQALANTQRLLQSQLPNLDDAQWADMFSKYAPSLCVEPETGTVVLEENSLVGFANWVNFLRDSAGEVPLYGSEAFYLARNLVSYSQDAKELLAADPELSQPESIGVMRALFSRLSAGNSVAERVYHACQKPVGHME